MKLKLAFIPHLTKTAVRDFSEDWTWVDPSDPPLSEEGLKQVSPLTDQLFAELGAPFLIAAGMKTRCMETASEARSRFGDTWQGGCPFISLVSLCQPENGDLDPQNPQADENGHVYYGQRVATGDWAKMCAHSINILGGIAEKMQNRPPFEYEDPCAWIFSSRPLAAAARSISKAEGGAIDAMDPTLLPYTLFAFDSEIGYLKELERKRVA